MIGHFISEKGELVIVILGLKELEGEYSGENQARVILDMLNDFEIRNKLGYMVINNVGSNNTLISTITTLLNNEGVLYNTKERRL